MMVSFVLSFFPRDVLDEILNLIESVSEDFPSYSYIHSNGHETCQSYNDQIIMKHMYMCIHLWFELSSEYLPHVISTNFETGLPRYNLCIFRRG